MRLTSLRGPAAQRTHLREAGRAHLLKAAKQDGSKNNRREAGAEAEKKQKTGEVGKP
jgi:hypothetical protein